MRSEAVLDVQSDEIIVFRDITLGTSLGDGTLLLAGEVAIKPRHNAVIDGAIYCSANRIGREIAIRGTEQVTGIAIVGYAELQITLRRVSILQAGHGYWADI